MPPLLVDCDPGLDDALALLALAELHRRGAPRPACVTAVAGNAPVELTARNAAFVLARSALRGTPVLAADPWPGGGGPPERHGPDGLGGLAGDAVAPWTPGAVRALAAHPGATILALGPLTNLARGLPPDGRVVAMGGRLAGGGEFNFGFDPAAARRVLGSGLAVTVVPVDLTGQVRFGRAAVDAIGRGAANPLVGALLAASLARGGGEEALVHDAVALLVLLAPELILRTVRARVVVADDGSIALDPGRDGAGGAVAVAAEIDAAAAVARLTDLWLATPAA